VKTTNQRPWKGYFNVKPLQRFAIIATLVALFLSVFPLDAVAGRSRGSFGGSRRSYSAPRSGGGGSFGRSRSSSPSRSYSTPRTGSRSTTTTSRNNSFGGSRLNTSKDYTSRYGTPRQTQRQTVPNGAGSTNYVVNRYGGMGDGFMMGYMMGSIPWYFSMPFHPAFYYSRPSTVVNPDGTTGIYPGTFQWGTLLLTLVIAGAIIYVIYVVVKARRRRAMGYTTTTDGSQSSFM
jgi:hypothetical protein